MVSISESLTVNKNSANVILTGTLDIFLGERFHWTLPDCLLIICPLDLLPPFLHAVSFLFHLVHSSLRSLGCVFSLVFRSVYNLFSGVPGSVSNCIPYDLFSSTFDASGFSSGLFPLALEASLRNVFYVGVGDAPVTVSELIYRDAIFPLWEIRCIIIWLLIRDFNIWKYFVFYIYKKYPLRVFYVISGRIVCMIECICSLKLDFRIWQKKNDEGFKKCVKSSVAQTTYCY